MSVVCSSGCKIKVLLSSPEIQRLVCFKNILHVIRIQLLFDYLNTKILNSFLWDLFLLFATFICLASTRLFKSIHLPNLFCCQLILKYILKVRLPFGSIGNLFLHFLNLSRQSQLLIGISKRDLQECIQNPVKYPVVNYFLRKFYIRYLTRFWVWECS